MILGLRRTHRKIFTGLGWFLLLILIIGLGERNRFVASSVFNKQSNPPSTDQIDAGFSLVFDQNNLWIGSPIRTRVMADKHSPPQYQIFLSAMEPIVKPDLLLYWTPDGTKLSDKLPNDAVLVGSWNQKSELPMALPTAFNMSGAFVLFDLADQEIVSFTQPLTFSATPQP